MVGNDTSLQQRRSRGGRFPAPRPRRSRSSVPLRRFAVEPGEEARHRRAVAPVRRARAVDLDRVLHRLQQRRSDRRRASTLPPASLDDPRQRVGGGRLVEPHGLAGLAERGEVAGEVGGRADVGELFERGARTAFAELAAVDEERRAALARDDREGERQRRVRRRRRRGC